MKTYNMQFPGDPVLPVEELSITEFLTKYPRTPIVISRGDIQGEMKVVEIIPMAPNDIECDCCGDDITSGVVTVVGRTRGYCEKCADEWVRPYRVVLGSHDG